MYVFILATTRIYYFPLIIYLLHECAFNQQKMNSILYIEGKCTLFVWGNYTYRRKITEKALTITQTIFLSTSNKTEGNRKCEKIVKPKV